MFDYAKRKWIMHFWNAINIFHLECCFHAHGHRFRYFNVIWVTQINLRLLSHSIDGDFSFDFKHTPSSMTLFNFLVYSTEILPFSQF